MDFFSGAGTQQWPDYRAVWRWHFYAGLFCIPFVVVLSLSGAVYLFKAELEAWSERAYDRLETTGSVAPVAAQIEAALAAVGESRLEGYELPQAEQAAARVIVRQGGEAVRVYVHPRSLAVLGTVAEAGRLMKTVFRLHGELLLGKRGSMLVELAASWTIVLILTGLVLWWPRHSRGAGGVFYPRLGGGRRIFWRDMHAVTGVWISLLALGLLISGLPWANFWGEYFKSVRRLTGTAAARQEWSTDGGRSAAAASEGGHAGHAGQGMNASGGGRKELPSWSSEQLAAADIVASAVRNLTLDPPVVIAPVSPAGNGLPDRWTAKSLTANRPRRENLVVDARSGAILSREGFADKHLLDQIVAVGIAAHEGRLFGWPNQLLGLLTALGLVLLSLSGVVLWWRRREPGELGAPPPGVPRRRSWPLVAAVVGLGILLPLFGLSLVAVLAAEFFLLRRIPAVKRWLGLAA